MHLSNIFISQNDVLKLGDFGLAKKLESNNHYNSILGDSKYMAPEAYKGIISSATDVWYVNIQNN